MIPLIFILVSLAILVGFFIVTVYEMRSGMRFFEAERVRFDSAVARTQFVIENVNLGEFARDEVHHLIGRIGHAVVYVSLLAVRSIERLLTRIVRHLRTKPTIDTAPRETAREFVKTLSDFKDNLKATHPKIPDIQ